MGAYDPYFKKRRMAAARRISEMSAVDFSLPVDGDVPAYRAPVSTPRDMLDSIVVDLTKDRSQFFDEVCRRWRDLFPDLNAKPGKWVAGATEGMGGRLFLQVRSAAASFAVRPRLSAVRRRLAELESAPRRFSVHIEIA